MSSHRRPLSAVADEDDETSDDSQSQPPDTYLVGFVIANIVGLQYYTGTIRGREMVGLVREPSNPYDPNAIRVMNTRAEQVGHVERNVARVLAPLVDEESIAIEGIVPNTPAKGARFRVPCQIHVFASIEAFRRVKSAIMRGGLALISENEAAFGLSQANVAKERRRKEDRRSVDEIFKMLDKNVREKEGLEAMEPPKDVILTGLLLHQKEGLGWLVRREISCELPPFWEERDGGYLNVLTNFMARARPEPMRGGILADDMGLGKTLMLLSLIALDKCGSLESVDVSKNGEIHDDIDDCEALVVLKRSKSKQGKPWKKASNSRNKRKIEDSVLDRTVKGKYLGRLDGSSDALESRTTLIVCPPAVFSSWITQLEQHTRRGKLSMYMYYGERTQDVEELKKYDIVLTTYSTLAAEEQWLGSPVKKIEWRRVILDEAHVIRNANTQQSRAVTSLSAKRRWVVTGTPIQNGSCDLYSLMAFLRFEPFCTRDYWNRLVRRPLIQGDEKGLLRLQISSPDTPKSRHNLRFRSLLVLAQSTTVLMGAISLRRSKDNTLIGLPPRTVETCYVDLSVEERELYDQMEGEAKKFVQVYFSADRVTSNLSTLLSIILRLRQICTNIALCPSDLRASIPSSNIEDVSNNPELLKKMVSILQDGEDFDCPICISPPTDIIITCCAHIFCRSCILKTLRRSKPCCPLCRRPLSESDIFSSPPETSNVDNTGSLSSAISSKVAALLKLLSASRDQSPEKKSIVFSQFTKMLILLEEPLRAAGFKTLRLDGSMNAKQRVQVIDEFGVPAPDGPTIMLASLKASSTGINLTAASNVYLMEPWWNPAVEQQAMDRVHRIGQKEDVKIVRMIARNSIDERILELQERKKKLAREALGREDSKDKREVNIDDLRSLMFL
ncbi:hypothetical protein RJ640_012034 [Escallonia rubra]|uniref:SWI/SNF-related matrix-associated actin-dependent regulator of chromatin subfamily A member 3-like 1 n=1 Tax=Escallonia rubra TaxID=112253 RepID=A0AA88R1J0_9ASTE|nr:hypothetical protein RJ640_012034 [Escallonia rubra]